MAKVRYSSDIEAIRGAVGERVYGNSQVGPTVREKKAPKQQVGTPAQLAARQNLAIASVTYESLTDAQEAAWTKWGRKFRRRDPVTGVVYLLNANMAFCGLACKFLQINPGGTLPLLPPTTRFVGDAPKVTATGGAGKITFTSDKANGAGVMTELLLQPLASRRRKVYAEKYVSRGFVSFASGALSSVVTVAAGVYAPAYRFVKASTGEEVGLVPLPLVEVS